MTVHVLARGVGYLYDVKDVTVHVFATGVDFDRVRCDCACTCQRDEILKVISAFGFMYMCTSVV